MVSNRKYRSKKSIFCEHFLYNEIRSLSSPFHFQFHKIGVILHQANLTGVDIRFKQSVEMFSLQVMQEKYIIEPCGFFVVDMILLQGVSYLLNGTINVHVIALISDGFSCNRFSSDPNSIRLIWKVWLII